MITLTLLTHLTLTTFKQLTPARATVKTQTVEVVKPTKTEITEAFRRAA